MRPPLRLALLALATLLARAAAAEPTGWYAYLAPSGGFASFSPDVPFPTRALRDRPDYGARLGIMSGKWFGLEVSGGITPTVEDTLGGRKVTFTHASADVVLMPRSGRYGGPFLLLGGAGSRLEAKGGGRDSTLDQGNFEVGAGLQFWITDALGLRIEARDLVWRSGKPDPRIRSHTIIFGGGVTLAFGGKPRDSDGDGVPDRKDRSPGSPRGARVDAAGAPLDSDGDGVFDGIDTSPNTPKGAKVDAAGAPLDSDGDGVFDGLDACPDTPKGVAVDEKGCPKDADGDGVPDNADQCPDTPKGAGVDEKGCPKDTDGDGVPDYLDSCADTPKGTSVDPKGCPDADRDGVPDDRDKCPGTAAGGTVDSVGCPVVAAPERGSSLVLPQVEFEPGTASLRPEALQWLDAVGRALAQRPELKVEIGVHTDSVGTATRSRTLSQSRARAVRDYLTGHFPEIRAARLSVRGYGASRPLAPNDSEENRAKNRRVEFRVVTGSTPPRE